MPDLTIKWDERKNKINQKRHGLAFEDAKFVFNDPNRIIIPDIMHGTANEERWNILGLVDKLLFVVYADEGDYIKIISARAATRAEQEVYNADNNKT